jgi:hypothetical protein
LLVRLDHVARFIVNGSAGLTASVKFEYSQPNARPFSNQGKTMKRYLLIMLGVLFCAGAFTPTTTQAGVFIEIGDRPYYTHGPWYWHHGYRWYWVPGHWAWRYHQRFWVHGHYARR